MLELLMYRTIITFYIVDVNDVFTKNYFLFIYYRCALVMQSLGGNVRGVFIGPNLSALRQDAAVTTSIINSLLSGSRERQMRLHQWPKPSV